MENLSQIPSRSLLFSQVRDAHHFQIPAPEVRDHRRKRFQSRWFTVVQQQD